jgi:hypothetical protein
MLIMFFTCASFSPALSLRADAQGLPVSDIGLTLTNTLMSLSVSSLEQKELVWDGLFYSIAKQALQQMTNDILKWVNSGFDGQPAFVTDLQGFLQNIADEVAGDFIYGDELSTICTPFQLDTRLQLAKEYQEQSYGSAKETLACSVDDYSSDPAAFISGNFTVGGWSAWFETVLNPESNTPIGVKLAASGILQNKINEKVENQKTELNWGDGFLSQKVCSPSESGGEKCTITTPGSIIKDQASFALEIPALSLINADEMNEVLGALFSNLAQQAITGINGLLGLGGNDSFANNSYGADGSSSYLDAMGQESATMNGSTGAGGNRIEQALKTESRVLELELDITNKIDDLVAEFNDAQEPYADDSCWDLDVPASITAKLQEMVDGMPDTVTAVLALEDLSKRYDEAKTTQAQLGVLKEFTALQGSGALQGQTGVIKNEYYLNTELESIKTSFEKQIDAEVKACS